MSKRIAFLSAAGFGALILTAAVVAPVSAQDKMMKNEMSGEKTVMVGGAAMFPSKNIIENAVKSKDHPTLVAAVKAAGGHRRQPGQAGEQEDADQNPHLSRGSGQAPGRRPDRRQEA